MCNNLTYIVYFIHFVLFCCLLANSAIQVPTISSSGVGCIATFGGGARYSNAVTFIHLTKRVIDNTDFFSAALTTPKSFVQDNESEVPFARTSAVAIRVGRYMIVQGGWSMSTRELGDIWVSICF
jgi:hypothetical protein